MAMTAGLVVGPCKYVSVPTHGFLHIDSVATKWTRMEAACCWERNATQQLNLPRTVCHSMLLANVTYHPHPSLCTYQSVPATEASRPQCHSMGRLDRPRACAISAHPIAEWALGHTLGDRMGTRD